MIRLFIIFLTIISATKFSQTRTLSIGDIPVSIGSKVSNIIDLLPKNISVSSRSSMSGILYIIQKNDTIEGGYKVLGSFNSAGGEVTSVTKIWGIFPIENYRQGLEELIFLMSKSEEKRYVKFLDKISNTSADLRPFSYQYGNATFKLDINQYAFSISEKIK
ncbi:MAG: hypothetical protein ACM3MI_08140 [Clostridiales bacterium]